MDNLRISNRLKRVASCVSKGNRVADIGCDHAYTAIYLIKNKISNRVIAMDINKGPLEKAKVNIIANKLEENIETRLSDGMDKLSKNEVDTILISGMGGRLINKILNNKIEVAKECKQLVLQPQAEIFLVRKNLEDMGFVIVYEDMIIDDNKLYNIIDARNSSEDSINAIMQEDNVWLKNDLNRELHYRFGKYLLKNKNIILFEYLTKKSNKLEEIIHNLNSNKDKNIDRIKELKEDLYYIREGLRYYEM